MILRRIVTNPNFDFRKLILTYHAVTDSKWPIDHHQSLKPLQNVHYLLFGPIPCF